MRQDVCEHKVYMFLLRKKWGAWFEEIYDALPEFDIQTISGALESLQYKGVLVKKEGYSERYRVNQ